MTSTQPARMKRSNSQWVATCSPAASKIQSDTSYFAWSPVDPFKRPTNSTSKKFSPLLIFVWAPLIAGVGYFFGSVLESALHDLKRYELWGFALILALGVTAFVIHRMRELILRGSS